MRSPLAAVAAAFAFGIALTWWLGPPAWSLAAVAGAIGFMIFRQQRHGHEVINGLLLIGIAAMGALRAGVDAVLPADSIARSLAQEVRPIICEGKMVGEVEWFRPLHGPVHRKGWFELTAVRQKDGWVSASGRLFLRLPARGVELLYGDCVRLHGEVREPRSAADDSRVFSEARWLWLHGASGVLAISDPNGVNLISSTPGLWSRYRRWVASFRWQLKQLSRSLLGPLEAAYLEAFLLGDGQGIPREIWGAFKRIGVVHVLVVSGQHVALIGYIIFLCLSFTRISRGLRYFLVAAALIVYCTLTGAAPPILRSTIMGVLLCIGMAQGREVSPLNSLGLAALLILAIHPRSLADVSFQLSFAAVVGLLVLSPWFAKKLKVSREKETSHSPEEILPSPEVEGPFQRWGRTIWQWIGRALAISCGAWTAISPVVAWHFHMFTPIALIANLMVVPWASMIIAVGFLVYAVGWINPSIAMPFVASFSWLVFGLNHGVTRWADLPGAYWNW